MRAHLFIALFPLVVAACSGGEGDNNNGSGNNNSNNNATNNNSNNNTTNNNTNNNNVGLDTTVDVSGVFAAGTAVRDAYSGATATVDADGKVGFVSNAGGVLLIEEVGDETRNPAFTWDNASVYFVMLDRFANGDTSNDGSYGRTKDGMDEVGTWHGGDLKGLRQRLDHIEALGANAIWITAFYEQIHGWVGGGGSGEFKHYAYHGYWALDFTTVDENYGSRQDLADFIDDAHARGIRVVLDVVMNHPGYPNAQDMAELGVDVVDPNWATWEPGPGENYFYFDALFDRHSENWLDWWGNQWLRMTDVGPSGPNAYPTCGTNELRRCVGYLPDFQTDGRGFVQPPPFFANKPGTRVTPLVDARVRDYLSKWLTDWVREYGIDGFRCDTAKHVELEAWAQLKTDAQAALDAWRVANPSKKLDDLPFWTTGEVFAYAFGREGKNVYHEEGQFDSLINFEFQSKAKQLTNDYAQMDELYADYAAKLTADPQLETLSYISSHDTSLFFDKYAQGDLPTQRKVGTALLLLPGAVQIFYGDETAREFGATGSDPMQGTRSDMNWDSIDTATLAHWQKLGQFRKRHPAIARGAHAPVSGGRYGFSRVSATDKVVVVLTD